MDFVRLAASVKRLIEKTGRNVTLLQPATEAAAIDVNQPWLGNDPTGAVTTHAGATISYPAIAMFSHTRLTDGASDWVRRGGQFVYVAADSVVDISGNQIDLKNVTRMLDGSELWQVWEVHPISPGPKVLLYQMKVKQ